MCEGWNDLPKYQFKMNWILYMMPTYSELFKNNQEKIKTEESASQCCCAAKPKQIPIVNIRSIGFFSVTMDISESYKAQSSRSEFYRRL